MSIISNDAYLVHIIKCDYEGFYQETLIKIARFKSLETAGYEAVMECLRSGLTLATTGLNEYIDSSGFSYFVRSVKKLNYESNSILLSHLDSLEQKTDNPDSNQNLVFPSLEALDAKIEDLGTAQ